MILWHGIVNAFVTLPGAPLLVTVVGLIVAWHRPRVGYVLIILSTVSLITLSLPITAQSLARSLETVPPLHKIPQRAQIIVVLAAGRYCHAPEYQDHDTVGANTLVRLKYVAYLYNKTHLPVLTSGGAPFGGTPAAILMRSTLEQYFHVPVQFVETRSKTTAQNARYTAKILQPLGVNRILLVTQAWHMPRAAILFRQVGFDVMPAPTGFITKSRRNQTFLAYLPSAPALALSAHVFHERVGLMWIYAKTLLPAWLTTFINNP